MPTTNQPTPPPTIPAAPSVAILDLRLIDYDGQPFANRDLVLTWGSRTMQLKTDADGVCTTVTGKRPFWVQVPPDEGTLQILSGGGVLMTIRVLLTAFGEPDTDDGRVARLNNLGLFNATSRNDLAPPAAWTATYGGFAKINELPFPAQTDAERDRLHLRMKNAHDTSTGPLSR